VKGTEPRSRRWTAVAAAAAGLAVLVIVLVPVAETHGIRTARWLRFAFSPSCHQIGDRCLDLGPGPMPVCARCLGIYAGGFVGLLVTAVSRRRFRPPWTWLAVTAVPSVLDFAFGKLDLPTLSNWPRLALAFIPALLLGLLLADAISSIADDRGDSDRVE
jgi:uncharacterized membrane protein